MGISKAALKPGRDIYIDYPFEEVMFRWDSAGLVVYRKFYGEPEGDEHIPSDNRLFHDALSFGDEISRDVYVAGKAAK
jgi:hypothetical protein